MRQKILTLCLNLLLLMVATGTAKGVIAPNEGSAFQEKKAVIQENKGQIQEFRQEIEDRNQARIQAGCEDVEKRIDTILARYENNRTRQTNRYQHIKEVTSNLAIKLKEQGYDISQVQTALEQLGTKIQKFDLDAARYMEELGTTQQYACGQSDGQFRNQLQAARSLNQVVQDDVLDIRNHYQTVVRPAIQALRTDIQN